MGASAPEQAEPGAGQAAATQVDPQTRLDRILALVPRALSSHVHVIFLGLLGIFLVILPLVGVAISQKAMLIGGNYTNVTSDLGACIAAGLTVHLVKRDRRRGRELEQHFRLLHDRHTKLEEQIQRAAAAAERAEAAAIKAGGSA
jgi:hypothetical protein